MADKKTLGEFIDQYIQDNYGIIASAYFYYDQQGNPCVVASYADGGMDYLETFTKLHNLKEDMQTANNKLASLGKKIKAKEKELAEVEKALQTLANLSKPKVAI